MADEPLRLSDVLREEYVRLHGDLPADKVAALDALDAQLKRAVQAADGDREKIEAAEKTADSEKLKVIYAAIHALNKDPKKARTALCFSGGGIRSATFALGIMQRLASFKLMTQFHFLARETDPPSVMDLA